MFDWQIALGIELLAIVLGFFLWFKAAKADVGPRKLAKVVAVVIIILATLLVACTLAKAIFKYDDYAAKTHVSCAGQRADKEPCPYCGAIHGEGPCPGMGTGPGMSTEPGMGKGFYPRVEEPATAKPEADDGVARGFIVRREDDAGRTPAKKGRVRVSPPGITGTAATNSLRSSAVIARIVNQRKTGIEYIYKKYLRGADPKMEGKIVVQFTVDASGAVTACSVVSSSIGNPAMEQEVCDRIMMWRFPPINAGDVTVVYPFVFFMAGA